MVRIQLQDPASVPLPSPHPYLPLLGCAALWALVQASARISLGCLVLQDVSTVTLPLLNALAPLAGPECSPGDPGHSPSNCASAGDHLTFAETDAPVTRTNQFTSLMLTC